MYVYTYITVLFLCKDLSYIIDYSFRSEILCCLVFFLSSFFFLFFPNYPHFRSIWDGHIWFIVSLNCTEKWVVTLAVVGGLVLELAKVPKHVRSTKSWWLSMNLLTMDDGRGTKKMLI